jgi:hypothetical protein
MMVEINEITPPMINVAFNRVAEVSSSNKVTGTSNIEIDDVSEAIDINVKNAKATKAPAAPID